MDQSKGFALSKFVEENWKASLAFLRSPLDSLLAGFLLFSHPWCRSSTQMISHSPFRLTSCHGAWREFGLLLQLSLLLFSLSSPFSFSLSFRLSPPLLLSSASIVSQGVCPKWLSPTWQHLLQLLLVACRHVGLVPPMICSYNWALLPSMIPVPTVDGCCGPPATRLSLGFLLTTPGRVFYHHLALLEALYSSLLSFGLVWILFSTVSQMMGAKRDQSVAHILLNPALSNGNPHFWVKFSLLAQKRNQISLHNLSSYLPPYSTHNTSLTSPDAHCGPSYPPRHRLPCIVSRLLSDCLRAGLLLPPTLE